MPLETYTKQSTGSIRGSGLRIEVLFSNEFNPIPVKTVFTEDLVGFSNTNTLVGEKLPTWRSLIKNQRDASTSLVANNIVVKHDRLVLKLIRRQVGGKALLDVSANGELQPSLVFSPDADSNTLSKVNDRAIVKFLQAAKSTYSFFGAGENLVEWRQTWDAIRHPLASVKNLTFAYIDRSKKIRRRFRGRKDITKRLADEYLRFQFGWRPLVFDIQDAFNHYLDNLHYQPVVPVTKGAKIDYHGSNIMDTAFYASGNLIANRSTKLTGTVFVTYKGGIRTDADQFGSIRFSQASRLLPEDFVPTIYELIPYSFVVDYFTNIGEMVEAISFPSSRVAWLQKTYRYVKTRKVQLTDIPVPGGWYYVQNYMVGGSYLLSKTQVLRYSQIDPSTLIPSFRIKLPLIGDKPWRNIAALLAQHIAKHK
jgi:hypothetical protein